MTYEYEKENIRKLNSYNVLSGGGNITKPIEELQEVYRKAKAFDAIVDIEDDFVKYHGFSPCVEEYAEEVKEIISEYMEDTND